MRWLSAERGACGARWGVLGLAVALWLSGMPGRPAEAAQDIAGLWASYDDSGQATGFIRLTRRGAEIVGVIEKGVPGESAERTCEQCPGDLKGRRLLGLEILHGAREAGEQYVGGNILDPFSGHTHSVRLTPSQDGSSLQLRAFIGLELFGRTQVWHRAAVQSSSASSPGVR